MTFFIIGLAVAAAVAGYVYLVREALGPAGLGLAVLRAAGLGVLLLLIVNPLWPGRSADPPTTVLLDRSLSMGVPGGHWDQALDTARSIAGADGTVLAFGATVGPLQDSVPHDGASRLADALRVARAVGGPVHVVTDGEIADAPLVDAAALAGVTVTVLPRDTVPGVALVRATVPETVHRGDTMDVTIGLATWGGLSAESTSVDVLVDGRRLVSRTVLLPRPPAFVTRSLRVPTASLAVGDRIVEVRQHTPGDSAPEDDVRIRVARVTADPPIIVIADPADWDARYVYAALASVAGLPLQGFARVAPDRWVDMASGRTVAHERVTRAARLAALTVFVGARGSMGPVESGGARWWWRRDVRSAPGDWYPSQQVPPSPMAGVLARIPWDSLPPLEALARSDSAAGIPVLTVRQGRRGAERPLLLAYDDRGGRALEMLGMGVYRWGLRGGVGAEALRTLVAVGVDWLLRSERVGAGRQITSASAATRGNPISFRWLGDEAPDSLRMVLSSDGSVLDTVVRFGPQGVASLKVPVGVYRWTAREIGVSGTTVVEPYSDEFRPRHVWKPDAAPAAARDTGLREYVRDRWWIFLLAVAALAGEWAWRQRRGLP